MNTELRAKNITWANLEAPDADELAAFVRETQLDRLDAEFIVQNHHRPEITWRDRYVLFLLQVPVFDKKTRVTSGVPLYLLADEYRLWTLHYEPLPPLHRIIQEFQDMPAKQEEYFSDTAVSLALYIINGLNNGAFRKLERLQKHIEIVADAVFHGHERQMVEEITVLKRDVMDFRLIMRAQRNLFGDPIQHPLLPVEAQQQWARLHGQMQRLWDMLESLSEKVKELGETNDSLLQHKENQLLRLLTIYSIIAIPALMLVAPFNFPDLEPGTPMFYLFAGLVTLFTLILIWIFVRGRGRK